MADIELFCERCGRVTAHTRLADGYFICNTYGCGKEREYDGKKEKGNNMANKMLTDEEKDKIRARSAAGISAKVLAEEFGIKPNAIWYYTKGPGKAKKAGKGRKKKVDSSQQAAGMTVERAAGIVEVKGPGAEGISDWKEEALRLAAKEKRDAEINAAIGILEQPCVREVEHIADTNFKVEIEAIVDERLKIMIHARLDGLL